MPVPSPGACLRLRILLPLLLLQIGTAGLALPLVWTESALVKVGPQDPAGAETGLHLQAARGETEWAQVVFRAQEATQVQLAVEGPVRVPAVADPPPLSPVRVTFHPAVYVHVSHPSGNAVQAPGYWPEVLPISPLVALPAGSNQPVYVEVRVPRDTAPGVYRGAVCYRSGGQRHRLPLILTVWNLTLPRVPTVRTSYYLWWDGLQKRFNLKSGTPQWRTVRNRFFWFLVDRRLCPMSLPVDLREGERYLRDPRVNGVRLPYVGSDAEIAGAMEFARRRGWLERCFYYLYDEPARRQWPEVLSTAQRLQSLGPAQRLDTIQPEPELSGAVNIWCPNIESVYLHEEAVAAARARGEEVWWYTCCVPKYPYPTFLLDDDAIAPRLLFWAGPRYDLTGSLYINTLHWGPEGNDIWQEAAVSPELLANNDGLIMYTGRGTSLADAYPVTGVRLEMIRDGLEDVELLNLLRAEIIRAARSTGRKDGPALARRHLQALASQVMPDLRHCNRQPRRLQAVRRRAADETLRLRADPASLPQLLSLPLRTVAEPEEPVAPDKFALALRGTPTVDGALEEPAWEAAAKANAPGRRTTIGRLRNLTGRDWPSEQTLIHWLYDDTYLYCSFACQEPEPPKLRLLPQTPDPRQADRVGVELALPQGRVWCLVTADGTQFGGCPEDPAALTEPWWQARTQVCGDGYTVEMAFPRTRLADPRRPLFNLFRFSAPGQEALYFTGRFADRRNPFQLGTLLLAP